MFHLILKGSNDTTICAHICLPTPPRPQTMKSEPLINFFPLYSPRAPLYHAQNKSSRNLTLKEELAGSNKNREKGDEASVRR